MEEQKLGDSYVTKFWPDDSSAISVIEETLTRYFKLNTDICNSDSIFRIAAIGCGPSANVLTLEVIVKTVRTFNPKKKIEIYMADLTYNLLQFEIVKNRFKELKYKDIFVFTSVSDFYEQNFSTDSLDLVYQYSCFCYPEFSFQCPEYSSLSYFHGFNFNEKIEKYSVDILKKILEKFQIQLKPKGMLITVDYGAIHLRNPHKVLFLQEILLTVLHLGFL